MTEQSWLRKHWKLVVNILTIIGLLILLITTRHQIGSTFSNLKHVRAWVLLLMIPIEIINYHAQAKMYQRLFSIVGNKMSYKFLFRASLELNFVNHVFPSGGVTGLSYFTLRLKNGKELSSGKASLIHVMKLLLYLLAFELILVLGIFALAARGRVNNLVILAAGSITTILVIGTVLFLYIIGSRERINSFFTLVTRILNRIIQVVRPKYPETLNITKARALFDDFHNNYIEVSHNISKLKAPFWYSVLADSTEIAAVYVVYIAFGKYINVGAVVLAYGIANFAGLISVMPGGIGIYEGLMTAALASTGISPGVSLPVTIMYRIVNTLIQVPLGYGLYIQAMKTDKMPRLEAN